MNTIDLSVTTITGTIPATNLPVGTGSSQVAAGNDPRLALAPRVVANIAALRALTPPVAGVNSDRVIVQGYYAAGDGGGGEYQWDAAATGRITQFRVRTIYEIGSLYPNPVTVTIGAPPAGGTRAVATATVGTGNDFFSFTTTGNIIDFTFSEHGSGYTSEPTVTITPGPTDSDTRRIAEIHAWGPDFEDGGYCLTSNVTPAGRWRLVTDDPTTVDLAHFGLHFNDSAFADWNSDQIAKAIDRLPLVGLGLYPLSTSGTLFYGGAEISSKQFAHEGTLLFPNRDISIGKTLAVTPYMTLDTGSGITTLRAKPGFTDSTKKWMLSLALNSEYHTTSYPAAPDYNPNVTYNFVIRGHLTLFGNWSADAPTNGVRGAYVCGAQGCYIDHLEVESTGLGTGSSTDPVGQIVTTISANSLTCLGGAAPGVVIGGATANTYGYIDCEHLDSMNPDADGDPQPAILVTFSRGISIDTITGERAGGVHQTTLQLKVYNSPGLHVNAIACNEIPNYVLLRGVNQGFTVESMTTNSPGSGGNWITDADGYVLESNNFLPLVLPQGTPSYTQFPTLHGIATADTINAKAMTIGGQAVVHEVFRSGNKYGNDYPAGSGGRSRLKMSLTLPGAYSIHLPAYIIHASTDEGKGYTALLSFVRSAQGFGPQLRTTLLDGSGLLLTPSLGDYDSTVLFSLCKPAISSGMEIYSYTVTQIGAPDSFPGTSVTWIAEPEDNPAVVNGTALPNVFPPVTPDSTGKVPALALKQMSVSSVVKTGLGTIAATDPDIEAYMSTGGYTLTLHAASGNAGLVRTISNITATSSSMAYPLTLATSAGSSDRFVSASAAGLQTYSIPGGTSVRLKVDSTGSKFIIV